LEGYFILEEFGPMETYQDYKVLWDHKTAVAFFVDYHVLVCAPCNKSLHPSGIENHFRNFHPEICSSAALVLATKYAHVLLPWTEVPNPPPSAPPVPFLQQLSGYACPVCSTCGISRDSVLLHLDLEHQSITGEEDSLKATIQTWYGGNYTRYFQVCERKPDCASPPEVPVGIPGNESLILHQVELKLKAQLESLSRNRAFFLERSFPTSLANWNLVQSTPLDVWLEKTRWVQHFDQVELSLVVEVREELAKELKPDGRLFRIHTALGLIFKQCADLIPEVSPALLLRVRQIKTTEESTIPFRTPQTYATHKRYVKCWQEFICYMIFQSSPCFEQYHLGMLRLTDTQQDLVSQIISLLAYPGTPPHNSLDTINQLEGRLGSLLQQVSLTCIEQDIWKNSFHSPLLHYLAVLGIDQHNASYHDASSYTGYLASILYCARLLMIQSCVQLSNQSLLADVCLSPCQIFQSEKAKYMMCSQETPFAIILDQLALGIGIQKRMGGSKLVMYSEEKDEIIFKWQAIRVDMIRNLLETTLIQAEKVLVESLFVPEDFQEMLNKIIPNLRDDTSCAQNGASLATQNPKIVEILQEQTIKRFLIAAYCPDSSSTNATIFVNGTERISPAARFQFEESRVLFLESLLLLMHMTGGGPPRGTEMSTLQFANTHIRHRNVFFLGGEMLFVTSYHKGQSRYGTQKYIPRFLPYSVGRLLLAYLLYLVPFESVYLRKIHSWPPLSGERTHRLWCCKRGVWDTQRLTDILKRECLQSFGTDITTASWRHISIAMMRHWVQNPNGCEDDSLSTSKDSEDASELQAGHSTEVGNLRYACRMDISNTLSSQSIRIFSAVSHDWHTFLYLSPESTRRQSGNIGRPSEGTDLQINMASPSYMPSPEKELKLAQKRRLSMETCRENVKR
jgi:hypothetical protein